MTDQSVIHSLKIDMNTHPIVLEMQRQIATNSYSRNYTQTHLSV